MPKTDVKLYSTDAETGAKQTTTISYVNPSASGSALKNFAQQLNSLTTNTYTSSDRIETLNLDTEEPSTDKLTRSITFDNLIKGQSVDITITKSEGETLETPTFVSYAGTTATAWTVNKVMDTGATTDIYRGNIPSTATSLAVGTAETAEYYAQIARVATTS